MRRLCPKCYVEVREDMDECWRCGECLREPREMIIQKKVGGRFFERRKEIIIDRTIQAEDGQEIVLGKEDGSEKNLRKAKRLARGKQMIGAVIMCLPAAFAVLNNYLPYSGAIVLIIMAMLEMCHMWLTGFYLLTDMKPIMIVIEKIIKDEK